jgi:hypothetical protein
VTGIIDCAVLPFMFAIVLAMSQYSSEAAYYALWLPALASLAGIPIMVGALKMKRLESRRFALASSILAMIPRFSPAFLLGVPMGIWSLIVLTDPEVKAAFAKDNRNQSERPLQTSSLDGTDHAPSERPGRGFGASLAEHPVLWTVAIVLTLPLIGTLLVIASVVSRGGMASNEYLSLPAGILVIASLAFTPFAFLAWAYLWRASHREWTKGREQRDRDDSNSRTAVEASPGNTIASAVVPETEIRARVRWPATALLLAGILGFAGLFVATVFAIVMLNKSPGVAPTPVLNKGTGAPTLNNSANVPGARGVALDGRDWMLFLGLVSFGLIRSFLLTFAGLQMKQLAKYRLAVASSLLAPVPNSSAFLILWSLIKAGVLWQ